jgi:class 3 adenylate cyclase
MRTRNVAIMMTDIKGFTARTSEATRAGMLDLLTEHDRLLRPVFRHFRGTIVKTIGDAFLVWFESPTDAVLCGLTIQEVLRQNNARVSADQKLEVRVAINSGEVEFRKGDGGDDIFGEPVNLTARLEGITEAGEVWFTEAVHLTMNRAEAPSSAIGERTFKGIPDPVRVYKVIDDPNSDQIKKIASLVKFEGNVPIIAGERPEPPPRRPGRNIALSAGAVAGALAILIALPVVLVPKIKDRRAETKVRALMAQNLPGEAYLAAVTRLDQDPRDATLRVLAMLALTDRELSSNDQEDERFTAIYSFANRFPEDPEVWWVAGQKLDKIYIPHVSLLYFGHAMDLGAHAGDPNVFSRCVHAWESAAPGESFDNEPLQVAQKHFPKETLDWARKAVTGTEAYPFLNAMHLLQAKGEPASANPLNVAVENLLTGGDFEAARAAILAEPDPARRAWVKGVLDSTEDHFYFPRANREDVLALRDQLAPKTPN